MINQIKNIIKKIKFYVISKIKKVCIERKCNIGFYSILEGKNIIRNGVTFAGHLGFGTYINENCNIYGSIGRYCSIASEVNVILGKHPTKKFVSTHPSFFSLHKQAGFTYINEQLFEERSYADETNKFSVVIGNDVWIGNGVSIIEGVKIGDGAIIAAKALVTKDVEPYAIYGGIPAKKIGQRFDDQKIEKLLELKWWTKEEKWIKHNAHLFCDIDVFLDNLI